MLKIDDIINSEIIYEKTWLQYNRLSSKCYRLQLDQGLFVILIQKNDYLNMKDIVNLEIYIEPGYQIYKVENIGLNLKQIKYISTSDYLEGIFKKRGGGDDGKI